MRYFVIGDDGLKYGPADVATLNGWIAEGRLLATTVLENELTGEQAMAQAVPGLAFQAVGTPLDNPLTGPIPTPRPEGAYAAYPRTSSLIQTVPKGFNWGAFYFSWIWGLNHKKYIMLLMLPVSVLLGLVPGGFLASLGIQIWLGFQGNQWAWESGRFSTITDMMDCQRIWAKWALGVFITTLVLACIGGILFAGVISQMANSSTRVSP